MSKFFDKSPAKKQRPAQETASSGNGSGSGDSDGFKTVGEVFPGRVCPVPTCPTPKQLLVRYVNGRPFVVCSNQVKDDPTSCQFSANKFGKDRSTNKGKSSIACITCDVPVEFVLSIGKPNGEFHPTTGKPKYDNVHVYFDDCWGKRTNDPVTGKTVLAHCTTATEAVIGTPCAAYDREKPYYDLKDGCTGDINEGDTIIRSWALQDPPVGLHARCAKRKHADLIAELIAEKAFRKTTATTAEDTAKAPSVEVPPDFEDF